MRVIPFLNQSAIFVGCVVELRYYRGSLRPLHGHKPDGVSPSRSRMSWVEEYFALTVFYHSR